MDPSLRKKALEFYFWGFLTVAWLTWWSAQPLGISHWSVELVNVGLLIAWAFFIHGLAHE